MRLDAEILARYSDFAEAEGEPTWANIPLGVQQAHALGLDPAWVPHLTANVAHRECVSRRWRPVAKILPSTARGLAEKTATLAVLKTAARGVSLVYFLGDAPDFVVRRGYAPAHELPAVAKLFPIDLQAFFGLHDGFVSFLTDEQGPLPTHEWTTFPHRETGDPSLVKIVQDGSNAFGFDISESPSVPYLLRPEIGEIEVVTNPWGYLDSLMAEIFEEL